MKRINNIFKEICTIDNINLADENARKGKTKSKRYINIHDQKKCKDNQKLLQDIKSHNFKTSLYSFFYNIRTKGKNNSQITLLSRQDISTRIDECVKTIMASSFYKKYIQLYRRKRYS